MSKLADAIRTKYGTRRKALDALGISMADLDVDETPIITTPAAAQAFHKGWRIGMDLAARKEDMADYTRDRGYTRARRMGRDQEESRRELDEMMSSDDTEFGDVLAKLIEHCEDDPDRAMEVNEALREVGEDARGPRSWARDRMERRRLGRDAKARRARDTRRARDNEEPGGGPEHFQGEPLRGGGMYEGEDRSRHAMDLAFDRAWRTPPTAAERGIDARFPGVRNRYGHN